MPLLIYCSRLASCLTTSALPNSMKFGNDPMSRLAHAVQERDKVCTTFTTRRKQAQNHYDHLMLANCDCSDAAKKKYYQSLQEALRESTRDCHVQKLEFESGLFSSLSPDLREDSEKVWWETTMEHGWVDAAAPTARLYYPVRRRMRADYLKAVHRRYIPDPTDGATMAEESQLRLARLPRVSQYDKSPRSPRPSTTPRTSTTMAPWA